MRRLFVRVATAAVAFAVLAAPASADTPRVYRNQGTGECLHHNGTGVVTTVASCSLTNGALHWHAHDVPETPLDDTDRRIVSSNGGMCLTTWLDNSVFTLPCTENDHDQLWWFEGSVANGYRIRNSAYGTCLGSPSNGSHRVNAVDCGNSDIYPFRRWKPLS